MSAIRTRARRAEGSPTVLLQGRVAPEARDAVHKAAARSGVSVAYYLEKLIIELEEDGGLPVVEPPRIQHLELPIPAA